MTDGSNDANSAGMGESFPAARRVKHRGDFERIFKRGKVAADGVLVIHGVRRIAEGQIFPTTRLGLSVSKKVGSAPVRNRWKRLIREAFRTQFERLPESIDLVVRPKRGAQPSLPEIRKSLLRLAKKIERKI